MLEIHVILNDSETWGDKILLTLPHQKPNTSVYSRIWKSHELEYVV